MEATASVSRRPGQVGHLGHALVAQVQGQADADAGLGGASGLVLGAAEHVPRLALEQGVEQQHAEIGGAATTAGGIGFLPAHAAIALGDSEDASRQVLQREGQDEGGNPLALF